MRPPDVKKGKLDGEDLHTMSNVGKVVFPYPLGLILQLGYSGGNLNWKQIKQCLHQGAQREPGLTATGGHWLVAPRLTLMGCQISPRETYAKENSCLESERHSTDGRKMEDSDRLGGQ